MAHDDKIKEKSYTHSAFHGLNDRDLVSVYKTAVVRKLKPGETLVKEGDTDETIYLLLDGTAEFLRGQNGGREKFHTLHRGDMVPGASSFPNGSRPASVVAVQPLSVLVLAEQGVKALSPSVQAMIYKNLNARSQQRLLSVGSERLYWSRKYETLAGRTLHLLDMQSKKYEESEIILGLLKGIPKLPMYANRLAVVILDENVSTRDVAELAKLDPSLVGIVLKTVNSSLYGFKGKISDFQHALLLLGFNQVYQLVMDVGLRNTMPQTPEFQELLFHSMVVSFASFEIANLCQVQKPEAVSTTGLLHDVGKSVTMLLKSKHPPMEFLIDLMDHAKLGSLLLKEWNIPEVVCRSLAYQRHPEWLPPEKIPEEYCTAITILYLAHLCYDFLVGKKENELPIAFIPEYLSVLKRPERTLFEFLEKALMPAIRKKRKIYPEHIRDFFAKGELLLVDRSRRIASPPAPAPSN